VNSILAGEDYSAMVVYFYSGQWWIFTPALTNDVNCHRAQLNKPSGKYLLKGLFN
jgi:hypothetical protein